MTSDFMTPPHSIEAEQSVLGGLLLDDDNSERTQKVLSILKPESFYSRQHQVIFAEMRQMYRDHKPVDLLTLFDALESKGLTETVGGFAYLAEMSKNTPSAANIVAYAMRVRETAMERYGIEKTTKAIELLYARNGMTAEQKFDAIQGLFTEINEHVKTGRRTGLRTFYDAVTDWSAEFDERLKPDGRSRGLSTGIRSLDELLGVKRIVRGSLFVIGARPKMGKTTLYTQMGVNCATVENEPALMFSLEMPEGQMVEKITAQKGQISPNLFYLNQVAAARLTTFSDWKVISDTARGDLTNIITDAVARGVNPRETASVISKRLDVSMSKAKTIAQTEQVGALRQAQWNETDWAADRLGMNTGLLWLSALKPTTRSWHASRHGKVYTTEQVRDFYAENGNRYNCYCSQIPVLLNDDGSIFNQGLAEKLEKERKQWSPDKKAA